MAREVAGLRRKLADIRLEADKCRGYQDDLEDCKVTDTSVKLNFLDILINSVWQGFITERTSRPRRNYSQIKTK